MQRPLTAEYPRVKRRNWTADSKGDRKGEVPGARRRRTELRRLQQFDLTLEYGPCVGISRMIRWERAERLGLNPPPVVRNLVLRHEGDSEYEQSLWYEYPL
uniref:DNA polymerase delta subunit 4-like protein n=1 Tax=Callorhinchus milii TaxID=7868 RepID=V9LJW0_CALMI